MPNEWERLAGLLFVRDDGVGNIELCNHEGGPVLKVERADVDDLRLWLIGFLLHQQEGG